NIPFVSLTCSFAGKEYPDDFGNSLSYDTFYEGMSNGEMPKTSQPSPEAFYKAFKEAAAQGKDIICICISSGLSGTFNSANIARNMMTDEESECKIAVIDTLTASLGQGLVVMKAVEMKESGASFDAVVDYFEKIKFNLNTYIVVDDLGHLKRGGRISSAAALVGSVLSIKPLLTFNDEGKVISVFKVKGRKNVINTLTRYVAERIQNPEEQMIAICHGHVPEEAEKLKASILNEVKVKDIFINEIGPVVGAYGGPGALAVFFIGKHRQNHIIDVDI
ncbi:MAG: DegV family protein, partial [Bacillota bacterium]|nr:DegV family protein [Bacillota bacterium]